MRGRPPKPTHLKVSQGTARKDRILQNEFKPSILDEIPKPTILLTGYAKAIWLQVCEELIIKKVITKVDLHLLEAYCIEMGNYFKYIKLVKKEGDVTTRVNKQGHEYEATNPKISLANNAREAAFKIANQFGFTPASRTKIAQEPGRQLDVFDEKFG